MSSVNLRPEMFNWGYLGCGDVCELKSAPECFTTAGGDTTVAAVMRRNIDAAIEFALRHGVDRACSTVDELLDPQGGGGVNAVYIATPPVYHLENALECIAKGIKYLYIEKPMTLNAEDARIIKQKAEEAGTQVTVAHYRNELPMYKAIEEMIQGGTVGKIRSVNIRIWQAKTGTDGGWRVDPEISGGGLFHDLSPHVLALMYKFFGPFKNAHGKQLRSDGGKVADQVTGMATFCDDIQFTGSWCFSVPSCEEVDECLVVGSKGSLRFPFFKGSDVTLRVEGQEEKKVTFEHPNHIQQPFIHSMMAALRSDGHEAGNPCSCDDAIAVMEVMDAFTQD